MGDTYTSPTTGNPLEGNASFGFHDPATGEFFTSDQIVGSVNESESPLDYIGGGGLIKGLGKGLGSLATKGAAKLLGKKAAKKAAKCPTCAGAAKKAEEKTFRGDSRTPEQIRDAGGFQGKDPSSPATLEDHLKDPGSGTNFVSTSKDAGVADSFSKMNPAEDGSSYVYHVDPKGLDGVDVSKISPYPSEQEVTFTKVPYESITGWERTTPGGGSSGFIPNPGYAPH